MSGDRSSSFAKKRKQPNGLLNPQSTIRTPPDSSISILQSSSTNDETSLPCTDLKLSEGSSGHKNNNVITYVEFYSGVGGWTMALHEALERLSASSYGGDCDGKTPQPKHTLKRLAALDHSDLCNRIYEYNFGPPLQSKTTKGPMATTSIERLSVRQMETWAADVWLMSPPCQPHTRQHENQLHDLLDPRSSSFLHICNLLETMKSVSLPTHIFLENVIGFETSNSCQRWRDVLSRRGYNVGHFHLTPTQVGLPNDRPRYFCVAVRNIDTKSRSDTNTPLDGSSDTLPSAIDSTGIRSKLNSYFSKEVPLSNDDSTNCMSSPPISNAIPELGVAELQEGDIRKELAVEPIGSFLDANPSTSLSYNVSNDESLQVPAKILEKTSSWCFDIVSPLDRRSACFTQSYGRFIRGTGSILYEVYEDEKNSIPANYGPIELQAPEDREFQADWTKDLDTTKLRYFSGQELTRLFGFWSRFSFPPGTSTKQEWKIYSEGKSMFRRTSSSDKGLLASTETDGHQQTQLLVQNNPNHQSLQSSGHHHGPESSIPISSSVSATHPHRKRRSTAHHHHQLAEEGLTAQDFDSSDVNNNNDETKCTDQHPNDHDNKKRQSTVMWKAACQYMNSTRLMVLVVLCLQNSLFTVLRRYSQGVLQEVYSKHELLLVSEVIKILYSSWMISKALPEGKNLNQQLLYLVETSRKMLALAFIYGAMNILSFISLRNISAGMFTIFAQLKIISTATFSTIILKRQYSWTQWRALIALMLGVLLFSEPIWGDPEKQKVSSKDANQALGTAAVLIEITLSGFASIYFEKVIKTDPLQLGIWERNFQLALGSFPVYILFIVADGGGQAGFFGGWSLLALLLSLLGAAGGLLVALSIKYGDSIMKTLATTGAIVLTGLLDHLLLGGPLTPSMIIAGLQVIIAICNYSFDATPPALPPTPAASSAISPTHSKTPTASSSSNGSFEKDFAVTSPKNEERENLLRRPGYDVELAPSSCDSS
ncbi:DNA methyltransferase [Nitzschia inconspicua]|uniref:DNA methyltransferase n=1 Tax=Nitzschia inconspicua TaxID=303405 RepID=A0A9K3LSU4_9STRA|nr:DNA methyltransferase [Nitzschia inconspicua]